MRATLLQDLWFLVPASFFRNVSNNNFLNSNHAAVVIVRVCRYWLRNEELRTSYPIWICLHSFSFTLNFLLINLVRMKEMFFIFLLDEFGHIFHDWLKHDWKNFNYVFKQKIRRFKDRTSSKVKELKCHRFIVVGTLPQTSTYP